MGQSSRYYLINQDILLEYIYTDISSPEEYNTDEDGIFIMKDTELSKNYLFANDSLEDTFRNTRDLSAVLLDESTSKYGYLDIDIPLAVNDSLSRLTNSGELLVDFDPDYAIPYDRFKIHFASGYSFEGTDGFIFEFQIVDRTGNRHNLSSITYLASDSYAIINPRPFLIGGAEFSSFFEVIIPSVNGLVGEYISDPTDSNALNKRLTNDIGIDTQEALKVKVSNINRSETINAQKFLYTRDTVEFSVPIADDFEGITANIEVADDGDYFLLSAQNNEESITDFISLLNTQPNSDWIILNDLFLLEQIGTSQIETSNETWIQYSGYENPRLWRPVIKNPTAVSYSIDYTIRLFNRQTNEQIIKRTVQTFSNVNTYGKSLKRIDLGVIPVIDEIYNLVGNNSIKMEGYLGSAVNSVQFVPNFFEKANILITNTSTFNSNQGDLSTTIQNNTEKFYKQGELKITVSPFDNYLKFVLFISKQDEFRFLNLTQLGKLKISFTDNNDDQITFSSVITETINSDSGEVLFFIPKETSKEIQSFINRDFYIIIETDDGRSNLVYSGKFETEAERSSKKGSDFISTLQQNIEQRDSRIENKDSEISKKQKEIERLLAIINVKDEEIQFLKDPSSTVQKTSPAKANLQRIENENSGIKLITSENSEQQKIDLRKKGSLLKSSKINPNV